MNITLEIPDSLYNRIKKHSIPFVDLTPISVIERWADHYEKGKIETNANSNVASPALELHGKRFNPVNPPDLTHTRCRGMFGTLPFRNWNDLLRTAHMQAFAKVQSFEALSAVTRAQIRKGNSHGDSGYHFVPEIDISIQGVDANRAWQYALGLAQYLKTPLRVSVEWHPNKKAAFPRKKGHN